MLQKSGVKQKSGFWKFVAKSAKILFVVEVVTFAVTYGVWHRMNTNRGKLEIAEHSTSWSTTGDF